MMVFLGFLLLAGLLTGAPRSEPEKYGPYAGQVQMPVDDIVQAGGVGVPTAWTAVGSSRMRPALSYYEDGGPMMVLTCQGVTTNVRVRGFAPKQAWPQPDMTIRLGAITRLASPDVRNIGTQVAYEFGFAIADEVLQQIGAAAPIHVDFDGQRRAFPSPPEELRRSFAQGCAGLVPAGMRASRARR